jgi:hypothetical protein
MQYNLLTEALWECDTTDGNKNLDFATLWKLAICTDDNFVYLNESDVMVIDIDLGHRIHLDSFEYRFEAEGAVPTLVASGIEFYYKDDSFEEYISLQTFIGYDSYYTTLSGLFAPRFLRVKHTVSGTLGGVTTSGSAYWLRALNDDSIVDFGTDGTQTVENLEVARGAVPDIREVAIYNDGPRTADAYISLEPNFSNIDETISVSTSQDGPWVYPLNSGDLIADSTNFDTGTYSSTQTSIGSLRLTSADLSDNNSVTTNTAGYYITPVVERGDNTYTRFVIDKDVNRGGRFSVDKEDPVDTIEVRSHNAKPAPYAVFRELYNFTEYSSASRKLRYRDRWLVSGSIKETSSWDILDSGTRYLNFEDYRISYDNKTDRWVGYAYKDGSSAATLVIFNVIGTSVNSYNVCSQSDNSADINYSWKEFKIDNTGGMWVYFYCQAYHSSEFVHSTGYYLAYFTSGLSNTFKWYSGTDQIGAMDVDYNNKYVWYTKPGTGTIYKLSNEGGTPLVEFVDEDVTGMLGGIAVMPDGGVIYTNGLDLHRLKYNGLYLSEYFMEDIAYDSITQIALDGDGSEAIWIIDGQAVGRLYISGDRKGTYDFRITVDYPVRFEVVDGGIWLRCADLSEQGGVVMRYISKENRRVDLTYRPAYNSTPGIIYQSYTHENYTDKMPVATDNYWGALPWRKVPLEGFLSNEDRYYQLRLWFRRQEPIDIYPDLITDSSTDFIKEDNFIQSSSTPNQLLWGNWRNKPDLDRVYVDTSTNELVLVPDPGGPQDAFIETRYRVIGGKPSGTLEARMGYKFGAGNGVISGKDEYLYIYGYSMQPGFEGKWIGMYLWLRSNPTTSDNYVYVRQSNNSGWTSYNIGRSSNNYEGTVRLHWNSAWDVYGQQAQLGGGFRGGSQDCYTSWVGSYFYFTVIGSRNSSELRITSFDIIEGDVYYYTDSPRVNSIYKQELLELDNIAPSSYKNAYLRTYVPKDLSVPSGNEVNMNVRWRVPTY